jgi:hypothetical protein
LGIPLRGDIKEEGAVSTPKVVSESQFYMQIVGKGETVKGDTLIPEVVSEPKFCLQIIGKGDKVKGDTMIRGVVSDLYNLFL